MRKTMISIMILALILGLSLAACRIAGDDPKPIKGEESELSWQLSLPEVDSGDWGLNDVYLDEDTGEAWAVGWWTETIDQSLVVHPLVLHYQDGQWAEDNPAADLDPIVGVLNGVRVAPNGEVWCVGTRDAGAGEVEGLILIRDGTGWVSLPGPFSTGWPSYLYGVAFESTQNAWVVGYEISPTTFDYQASALKLVDGVLTSGAGFPGQAVSIDWADKGYVVGRAGSGLAGIWERPGTDGFPTNVIGKLELSGMLNDIDLLADGSGWAVGDYWYEDTRHCLLVEHSGGAWTQHEPLTRPGTLTGVSMVSANEGWAVGYEGEGEQGILLSYLGGDWTEPFADVGKLAPYSWQLNAVSAIPTGEAWAVGTVVVDGNSRGIAFHYTRNRAPVLDAIGDQSYPLGGSLTFTVHATDPDGDPVTYSAFNLPPNADFDNATFTWTGPLAGDYQGDTVFIATDSHGLSDFEVVHISPAGD